MKQNKVFSLVVTAATSFSLFLPGQVIAHEGHVHEQVMGVTTEQPKLLTTVGTDSPQQKSMPGDKLKVPNGVSDECREALKTAVNAKETELDQKKLENKTALAALIKEKRTSVRAVEDASRASMITLEDTFDADMAAVSTVAEMKKLQQTFQTASLKIQKERTAKIAKIEKDFQKKVQELLKLSTTQAKEKPTLPSSCEKETNKLGTVKGAFIRRK